MHPQYKYSFVLFVSILTVSFNLMRTTLLLDIKITNFFFVACYIIYSCLAYRNFLCISYFNWDWTPWAAMLLCISLIFMQWNCYVCRMAVFWGVGNTRNVTHCPHPVKYERTKYFYSGATRTLRCVFILKLYYATFVICCVVLTPPHLFVLFLVINYYLNILAKLNCMLWL